MKRRPCPTLAGLALALTLSPLPGFAQGWTRCRITVTGPLPDFVAQPTATVAQIAPDGTVLAILVGSASGSGLTNLAPQRPGVSARLEQSGDRLVFNLISRREDGSYLSETWLKAGDMPLHYLPATLLCP